MTRIFSHIERRGSQEAGEGGRGPEQRGAKANRCQRRPESTATRERKRAGHAGNAVGPPRRANPLTPPVKGAAGGLASWGTSPPRSSPGWGPVARRPRLRSVLARATRQKPRGILLSISSHLGKYILNVWVSSHLGTRSHRTADVGGTDGHYTAITSPQASQPGWEALRS